MSEDQQQAGGVRVVDNIFDAAAQMRGEANRQTSGGAPETEAITGLAHALGREIYTWTSPWNSAVVVKFRRPRAGTDEQVARLLGDQADNQTLQRRYKALLSVIEVNGKPQQTATMTDTRLRLIRDQIGFVGPGDDDVFDEPINTFVTAYEMAMYPEQISAISEAQGIGLSVDDIARIAKNTGLERPKA